MVMIDVAQQHIPGIADDINKGMRFICVRVLDRIPEKMRFADHGFIGRDRINVGDTIDEGQGFLDFHRVVTLSVHVLVNKES